MLAISIYLISFYYFVNREYFIIPNFTDKYFIIPNNKEGEIVDYLDKKSLNNINDNTQDFEFKNVNELNYTIQLYSNDNFENINKYLNNLLENILDNVPIMGYYKKLNDLIVSTIHMINVYKNKNNIPTYWNPHRVWWNYPIIEYTKDASKDRHHP